MSSPAAKPAAAWGRQRQRACASCCHVVAWGGGGRESDGEGEGESEGERKGEGDRRGGRQARASARRGPRGARSRSARRRSTRRGAWGASCRTGTCEACAYVSVRAYPGPQHPECATRTKVHVARRGEVVARGGGVEEGARRRWLRVGARAWACAGRRVSAPTAVGRRSMPGPALETRARSQLTCPSSSRSCRVSPRPVPRA